MKYNVLLIYPRPDILKTCRFGFSLNLLYIASIFEKSGHNVRFVDYSVDEFNESVFINLVEHSNIVIIEFDAYPLRRSMNFSFGILLLDLIKQRHLSAITIAFGAGLIINPHESLPADYTYTTEPFANIIQVADALINNMISRHIECHIDDYDLDCLPYPARHLLSTRSETGGSIVQHPYLLKSTLIQTSCGCENTCSFCQRRGWYRQYRAHSIDYSYKEFLDVHAKGYKNVWITDDNFGFDIHRAKSLMRLVADEIGRDSWRLSLSTWSRIDRELIDYCYQAGVSIISIGIESVSPEILRYYKKNVDLDSVADIICYADSIGIFCVGNFIIGAPMETEETIASAIQFASSLPFDQVNVKILDYMRGSLLFSTLHENQSKGVAHLFACEENGLCDFTLMELRERAREFRNIIARKRYRSLINKICRCGPPYLTKDEFFHYFL